jgi:hypothetical protein
MTYGTLLDYYWDIPSNRNVVEQMNANRAKVGMGTIEDAAFISGVDLTKVRFAEP